MRRTRSPATGLTTFLTTVGRCPHGWRLFPVLRRSTGSEVDVETKRFNEAVKRNLVRFPEDFMFQLSAEEFSALRSQSVISNAEHKPGCGGRRNAPYAFTEQGVAMLSSVLSSERAVAVNIEIMRTFVRVRQLAATHADLAQRLAELENKTEGLAQSHESFSRNTRIQLKQVVDALRELMPPPDPPKRPIGFVTHEDKRKSQDEGNNTT